MSNRKATDPLITSLLDTDLYKITMLQAFYHAPEFRTVEVEWKFACRNRLAIGLADLIPHIHKQIEHLCSLSFTNEELRYLGIFPFFSADFIEFLRISRLDGRFVHLQKKDGSLDLRLRGPLIHVALFEIYLLAIISELHTVVNCNGFSEKFGRRRLQEKIDLLRTEDNLEEFVFVDFGTRRRASYRWQRQVLEMLIEQVPQYLAGSSNIHFAKTLGIKPIGTMAHEWFQAWQAVTRLADAQKAALEGWVREFRGRLGIALTDCYSMDSFIGDFSDPYFGKLYDGIRHDSGPPVEWGHKAIAMYLRMGIDPLTKTLVFSDSLDFPKMITLYRTFSKRVRVSFGIGTNLTNDVGNAPLDIVIKMVAAAGRPVAKISDEPGKSMCEDREYLHYLATVYGIDPRSLQEAEK